MFIAPNTTIKLLKDIPSDNTYRNTIYFADVASQTSYFLGKTKYTFANQSYQRVNKGKLRIARKADDLYDCNYLMFQNTAYGNKWFYAFVTGVDYVNNETSEVSFEIDVMQSWHFDYNVNMSFVEREMSFTDNIGENLVPENLEIGEYIYKDLGQSSLFTLYQIVIAATFDKDFNDSEGGIYGGVFSGLTYNVFSSWDSAAQFIKEATENNKSEGIVSVFMLPAAFCYEYDKTNPELYDIERDKNLTDIDGYIPKNNKLFTYPYNMLYVTNNEGLSANYPFEYFSTTKCTFNISGAMCCTPECMLVPLNYKGVEKNYNEKMIVGNFPQCAYTVDTFKAWVAQNQTQLGIGLINGIGQTLAGAGSMYLSGGIVGTEQALGGVQQVGTTIATIYDKSTLPPHARGGNGSIINMANEIKGFRFMYAHIRSEFAKIIDDYFSMYGYATHRVKVPNRSSRPHWNYVKTINVSITGSIPADDLAKIRSIYDSGITFWKNGDEVGFYRLDNRPNT